MFRSFACQDLGSRVAGRLLPLGSFIGLVAGLLVEPAVASLSAVAGSAVGALGGALAHRMSTP